MLTTGDGRLALLLEGRERRDSNQVSPSHHPKTLGLQDDVERLVPGHVPHADGDGAGHVVRRHDVHAAHLCQEAKDVVDVRVLEVEVDPSTAEASAAAGATHLERDIAQEGRDLRALALDGLGDGLVALLSRDGSRPRAAGAGRGRARREHPDDAVPRADGGPRGALGALHRHHSAAVLPSHRHGANDPLVALDRAFQSATE